MITMGLGNVVNDLFDIKSDKKHPIKSKRPIPSGRLSVSLASIFAIFLIIFSIYFTYLINPFISSTLILYLLTNSSKLKLLAFFVDFKIPLCK